MRINGVDYLCNPSDNIIEINVTLYNIHWEGKHSIIVDNNGCRIDTPPPIGKSAELAITSYLAYLAREVRVEQICCLLAQCAIESCPIPKDLGDVTRLLANTQKKWLKSCFEKLKSLKNRNVYEVMDLPKGRKAIKNH